MRRFWVAACVALALACLGGVAAPRAGAYVPEGGQGWYWQMPQPAGDLTDVTFASASDVWAVGLGGTIIHSGDAGATWTGQQSGTPADLFSVSFGDDQHGWTCGSTATGASIVLATSDGGTTWVDRTPGGLTRTLTNLSFVDASHGWAGTTSGFVMRTSDGGATWTSSRVGTSKGALTLDFVDATHGWAMEPEQRLSVAHGQRRRELGPRPCLPRLEISTLEASTSSTAAMAGPTRSEAAATRSRRSW